MKANYIKTCTSAQDLILLLKNRGLSIPDEQKAINYLSNIGYFRLSAYLYPLLKDPKKNHEGRRRLAVIYLLIYLYVCIHVCIFVACYDCYYFCNHI